MNNAIAIRRLLYSQKGDVERRAFSVGVCAPFLLSRESVSFNFDDGAAGCTIVFEGIPHEDLIVYGADTVQALALALDIDPYLRGLSRKYDIYWETGEPYFD